MALLILAGPDVEPLRERRRLNTKNSERQAGDDRDR